MVFKLGSLFDGSGGFPLAGTLCGIEPRWASEVEPYPIAVTRERFPYMKHLGDISKVNGAEIEPVDVITFGSPCQDLSVAGKRAGLKHEANGDEETTRSGLFMEAVRIIKEMREKTNGEYPRFALWENVPGAFSSNKGEDFRVVCEELIKIAEPSAVMPPVPKNGWAYADSFVGDGWSLAYRVFDAQYWGVPQRRRRIHLVVDLRGECAREVLFEREGLRGYFAQSGETGQSTSGDSQDCTGAADRETGGIRYCGNFLPQKKAENMQWETEDINNTLHNGTCAGFQNAIILKNDCKGIGINGEIAGTLDSSYYKGCGMRQNIEREVVAVPYLLKIRSGCEGGGKGALIQENKSATISTLNDQYLFQPVCMATQQCGADRHSVCYSMQAIGEYKESEIASAMKARDFKDATDLVCEVAGVDCRNMNEYPELYPTLQAKPNGGQSLNFSGAVRIKYIVRRLTPTECARLQGFADWWAHVSQKETLTDEEYRFWLEVRNTHAVINGREEKEYTKAQILTWYNKLYTDSAEYKMWGNGIALPPALYCMQGITEVLSRGMAVTEEMEATDLSDAPQEIKEEIMKNAETLEKRSTEENPVIETPAETKETLETVETRETEVKAQQEARPDEKAEVKETPLSSFNAVAQLRQLADERKALAELHPERDRFSKDVRAIEYAVNVLEAVGL